MTAQITVRTAAEADWPAFVETLAIAFGAIMPDDEQARWKRLLDFSHLLVATDEHAGREVVVGTAGWLPFDMAVPGGELPVAAVTMVTVRPTHRRQGILRRLMSRQFDDFRAEGRAVATLWASEAPIYPRFGYGLAFLKGTTEIESRRAQFLGDPAPAGQTRLIDEAEALDKLPDLYDRACHAIPGSFRRTRTWWEERALLGRGHGPSSGWLRWLLLEIDGRPEGYALYRITPDWGTHSLPNHRLDVIEALGTSPVATREVWRYLFSVDLVGVVRTHRLNADHPLSLMLADPRRLRLNVSDGTWIRLVDVPAALAARTYPSDGAVTFELTDEQCPWNAGVWTLVAGTGGAELKRSTAAPELRLSARELAAMYLGTVRCTSLLRAGRVEEVSPGAASRADALFRSDVPAWCLDDF
ncbi:MAG: GNAT family N-acetyltransferase [Chloroflexota bacterium]